MHSIVCLLFMLRQKKVLDSKEKELREPISKQVESAIIQNLDRPEFFPARQAIARSTGNEVVMQVTSLLQTYAPQFESQNHPVGVGN